MTTQKTWTTTRTQERGTGAMIAAKAKDLYEKEAKERQGERTDKHPGKFTGKSGDSRDKAGKAALHHPKGDGIPESPTHTRRSGEYERRLRPNGLG